MLNGEIMHQSIDLVSGNACLNIWFNHDQSVSCEPASGFHGFNIQW